MAHLIARAARPPSMPISNLAELKPILTTLVLPPAGPLLLMILGGWLAMRGRRLGRWMLGFSIPAMWLLSCNVTAVWLAAHLLPPTPPIEPGQVVATLQAQKVQAVVILGGGLQPEAPEYGAPQPSADAIARIRYGAWLARQSHLPLAFAGGLGWAAQVSPETPGKNEPTEGSVTRAVLAQDYGLTLRWVDDQSRDTAENATNMRAVLARDGIERIALVTSTWHMPRSASAFRKAGFTVLPAPANFTLPTQRPLLEWLPSSGGLMGSARVLREWLAIKIANARGV